MKDIALNPALATAQLGRPSLRRQEAGARDENAQNWQREMERMQAQAWLAHPVVGYTALATPPGYNAITAPAPAASLIVQQAGAPPESQAPEASAPHAAPAPAAAGDDASNRSPSRHVRAQQQRQESGNDGDSPAPASRPAVASHPLNAARADSGSVPSATRPPVQAVAAAEASATDVAGAQAIDARAPEKDHGALGQITAPLARPPLDARALAESLGAFGTAQVTVASAAAPPASAAPQPVGAASMRALPQEPWALQAEQVAAPSAALPNSGIDAEASLPLASEPVVERSARATPLAQAGSRPSPTPDADPQPGVRVHAEWSSDGVRLWLGMNNGTQENAAPIAAHLQQWLANQGHRTLSVICNGRQMLTFTRSRRGDGAPLQPPTYFSTEA